MVRSRPEGPRTDHVPSPVAPRESAPTGHVPPGAKPGLSDIRLGKTLVRIPGRESRDEVSPWGHRSSSLWSTGRSPKHERGRRDSGRHCSIRRNEKLSSRFHAVTAVRDWELPSHRPPRLCLGAPVPVSLSLLLLPLHQIQLSQEQRGGGVLRAGTVPASSPCRDLSRMEPGHVSSWKQRSLGRGRPPFSGKGADLCLRVGDVLTGLPGAGWVGPRGFPGTVPEPDAGTERAARAGTQHVSWFSVSAGPAAAGVRKELVGARGGAVTFPVTHAVHQIESIVWTFNVTPLVTIQPKMTGHQDNVIVIQNHNKERVSFPQGNYSLKLSKLTTRDTGTYRVTMYGPLPPGPFSQEYGLRVYGE